MTEKKDIKEVLRRHDAFWEMEEVEAPLMSVGRYNPLRRGARIPLSDGRCAQEGEYLTPEKIDPARFIDQRAAPPSAVEGAFIRGLAPYGLCWTEAILGCPTRIVSGSVWSEPFLDDWQKVETLRFTPENRWFQKLLAFTRALVEWSAGCCPVTQPLMRGPIDMAAAALGDARTCLAFYDSPKEMDHLLQISADTFIEVARARLSLAPRFHGGYLSGYGIWTPGTVVRTQADNATMLSPQIYRDRVLPHDRRIMDHFDYPLIHLHSSAIHIADELLEVAHLRAIQVSLDLPDDLSKKSLLPALERINRRKPLILTGPVTQEELDKLLERLSPRGLCLSVQLREDT